MGRGLIGASAVIVTAAHAASAAERLWLLGGLALSLTAAGVIAVAATRGRR